MPFTPTIGAFAIITNEKDQVLLVHRNDRDLWNLPGGGLEKGESPWECALCETKEETGLDVEITKLQGIYHKPEKGPVLRSFGIEGEIVFSFEAKIVGGEITLNEEARAIEYFDLENIPANTSSRQVERIHDYFNEKKKLWLKIQ